jgi:hypothetical protein
VGIIVRAGRNVTVTNIEPHKKQHKTPQTNKNVENLVSNETASMSEHREGVHQ